MNVSLFDLYVTFAKIGVMTFGGGYAMIPIMERELVDSKKWVTSEEILDYFAVGQCTPGIIAVNTATFIGKKLAGNIGGIIATLGVVLPSLIIITAIAGLLTAFSDYPAVQSAFVGIRVCVCVLVLNAVIKLWKGAVKDKAALLIFLVVFGLSLFFDISPIIFVILSAICGIVFTRIGVKGK